MDFKCLPAEWHNTPDKITGGVENLLDQHQANYTHTFCAYGDCGTGGLLDKLLNERGVERLPGAHCYEFYAGGKAFADIAQAELGTFYLTDYLTRNFDRLIKKGFALDRHPEIKDMLFAHYKKLIYFSQAENAQLQELAKAAADYLGLEYEYKFTGYGDMTVALDSFVKDVSRNSLSNTN